MVREGDRKAVYPAIFKVLHLSILACGDCGPAFPDLSGMLEWGQIPVPLLAFASLVENLEAIFSETPLNLQ